MPLEKDVRRNILAYLNSLPGTFWTSVHTSSLTRPGVPDIIGSFHGLFVGVEVKKPGGKQRESQIKVEAEIKSSKGTYILAESIEDVILGLKGCLEKVRRLHGEQAKV